MSWDTQLAREIKKRTNPKPLGACVGIVSSVKPFAGSILDGQFMLDGTNTYVCNGTLERKSKWSLGTDEQPQEIVLKEVMQVGDQVLVLPTADMQQFFVIDIIKGVE